MDLFKHIWHSMAFDFDRYQIIRRLFVFMSVLFLCLAPSLSSIAHAADLRISVSVMDVCGMSYRASSATTGGSAAQNKISVRCSGPTLFAISSGLGDIYSASTEGPTRSRPTIITISY
jgi:hypothetical protein